MNLAFQSSVDFTASQLGIRPPLYLSIPCPPFPIPPQKSKRRRHRDFREPLPANTPFPLITLCLEVGQDNVAALSH